MAKRARLTGAEEEHEEEEQHRYIIGENKREHVDEIILRMLSMDARTPLSEIAKEAKVSKTTVFHELNRLITEDDIHFVPEINLKDMWERELISVTKRMEKRAFRQLKVHSLGFNEFLCFVKFTKKKPTNEQILKAIGKSYIPQYIGRFMESSYDLIMYLVARNMNDITEFISDFQKNLPTDCDAKRYVHQILSLVGFFPLSNDLINEFKISDRYQRMLNILNENARGELSKMGMKKDMVTYLYRALLNYKIIERTTLYIKKPKNNFTGIIQFSILNSAKWRQNRPSWLIKVLNQQFSEASYTFIADIYNPFGVLLVVNARDPSTFEKIKSQLNDAKYGITLKKSLVIAENILGNPGVRNYDLRYSMIQGILETAKLVPKFTPKERRAKPKNKEIEYFELD